MSTNPVSLSSYIGPTVGVLGLCFAYERWVVEQRIHTQKELISELRTKLARQDAKHKQDKDELLKEANDAYDKLGDVLEKVGQRSLTEGDALLVQKILLSLKKSKDPLRRVNECRIAAQALKTHRKSLIRKACRIAISAYKESTMMRRATFSLRQQRVNGRFQNDIVAYLDWLYDCLNVGHPDKRPLSGYLENPSLPSPLPYLIAIREIRNEHQWKMLSIEQSAYLDMFFEELISRINTDFPIR